MNHHIILDPVEPYSGCSLRQPYQSAPRTCKTLGFRSTLAKQFMGDCVSAFVGRTAPGVSRSTLQTGCQHPQATHQHEQLMPLLTPSNACSMQSMAFCSHSEQRLCLPCSVVQVCVVRRQLQSRLVMCI